MPKSIAIADAILLVCLSLLAGGGLPILAGGGHPLATNADAVWVIANVALVTGLVMLLTELFSGHKFIALVAFAGVAAGWFSMYRTDVNSVVSEWSWIVGLLAVVLWFTVMASAARADR